MYRATTPTHTFTLPVNPADCDEIQVTYRQGDTTYYYIVDITSHGTTTHGNCFRVGGTRQVTSITSGYSWSYSGTTLTITSSASSRSASPGAFYNGSYELMYVY